MKLFGKSKTKGSAFSKKKLASLAVLGILTIGAVSGLTACKEKEVEYTFNTDGGVGVSNISIEKGVEFELPTPEKEGYEFEGWYTNPEFSGDPVKTVVAEENMTYYAKWTQLATITLELDGGTLSQTSFYLKPGENLYTFMQNYKPTKNGLVFGAWFNGNLELSETATMPDNGITLTARYKVAYTTEIYKQKLDLSGYEKAEDVVAYEYVGKAFTSAPELTGFKEVIKEATESTGATVASKDALSATASENLFRHYFDRESYKVTFNPNFPAAGGVGAEKTETLLYGKEISVPNDYECEGYCLIGWSTSATSNEVQYNAYYVDAALYNKEGETVRTPDSFSPERDTNLYAVWAKGYVDLFGGNDNIYLLGEEGVAYLSRGNVFFKGKYNEKSNRVTFGSIVGSLYDNNTFSYINDGKSYYLRDGQSLDRTTSLMLLNNTATYKKGGAESTGTFVRGEEADCYVITYTSGALAGQEMTVKTRIMSITDENGQKSNQAVFNVRNEDEVELSKVVISGDEGEEELGLLRVLFDASGKSGFYYPQITLDGFGVATLAAPTSESTYYYTLEEREDNYLLTLSAAEGGSSAVEFIIFEVNGITVYTEYNSAFDQTFTLASGDTLTLDGGCKAVYTVNGVAQEGYYYSTDAKSGALVTAWSGSETYKFLIEAHTEDKPIIGGDAGETEKVTTYTVERKPIGYAEYRYVENGSVYWAPLLVLDENEEGKATLYGHIKDSTEYVKVSVGTYQLVDEYYVYTVDPEGIFEVEGLNNEPFDLTTIASIVFQTNTSATEYKLMYWKSYTTTDNDITDYVTEYTSVKGYTLKTVGGFAFLTEADDKSFTGAYTTKDGVTTIIDGSDYRYVELGEDNTFILLEYAPYTAKTLTENDVVNNMEYVEFDGKGNATYVKVITPATKDTEAVTETTAGKAQAKGKTLTGEQIYEFKANDDSLTFQYINVPETSYIAKWNATYSGTFETTEQILKLDGFGYKAEYIDENGTKYEGLYTVRETKDVQFYVEEEEIVFYFDITEKTFTVKGEEYGKYFLVDNRKLDAYIDLDGYGNAKIYTVETVENEEVENYIAENATYTHENGVYTIQYTVESEQITYTAKLSTITVDGTVYRTVTVVHSEAVHVYVNEDDWSVLILDDIGNAVRYNEEGVKEEGTYLLVTDSFLYYASSDLSDACVYEYSNENGTATPVKFEQRSYFTSTLDRLIFSEYGYAYFGNTRYYYHEDENGNVMLYRYAKDGEKANVYGFVEDATFGEFDLSAGDKHTYDGKDYYLSDGFGLNLDRVGDSYPVQISNSDTTKYALQALTFNPGADEEYISMATVKVNNKDYDCYVIRERNENGDLVLYVSLGYYRFYINVTYTGTENTYTVTGLEYVRSLYSYRYLYTYFLNAMFFGTALEDRYGMVHICADYNEQGETTKQYIVGDFLEGMGLKDKDGNAITFEEGAYSYNRGIYGATFTAKDGNVYKLYFGLQRQAALGRYGFTIAALARHQVLTTEENGYEVTVERVVFTELSPNVSVGDIYTISMKKDGQALTAEALLAVNNTIYYVVRERAEAAEGETQGKITSTKYYHVKFTEAELGDSVEGNTSAGVVDYESVTVAEEEMKTYYMENGKVYVDVSETSGVTFIVMADGSAYVAKSCTYDETTKTYSGELVGGGTFTVVMLENDLVDVTVNFSAEA